MILALFLILALAVLFLAVSAVTGAAKVVPIFIVLFAAAVIYSVLQRRPGPRP